MRARWGHQGRRRGMAAAEAGVHGPSLIKRPDGHLDRPEDGPTDRFARDTPPIRMVRGRPDINGIKLSIPS
jgi:hypothetical protein